MTFKPEHPSRAVLLWLAQGFGAGWVPGLPGTFGSILGVGWLLVLIQAGSVALYLIGTAAGLLLSLVLCHLAEQILQQKDPSSVVMDEITAFPVCFLGWVIFEVSRSSPPFAATDMSAPATWGWIMAGLVAFRVFDIAKPWPIRQSQEFGGSLGVTLDDLLAAVYVNLVTLPIAIWLYL